MSLLGISSSCQINSNILTCLIQFQHGVFQHCVGGNIRSASTSVSFHC